MEKHFHRCPYCKSVYACDEGCFSTRINNRICASCKMAGERELLEVVRDRGTYWHQDILW